MIDCSKDLLAHELFYGLDMRQHRNILITHAHPDHYAGGDMNSRYQDDGEWHVYLPSETAEKEKARIEAMRQKDMKSPPNRFPIIHAMKLFEPTMIGEYRVTALPSNHSKSIETVLYIVEHNGKSVFWIHDSGLLLEETIAYLKTLDICFDVVSMDCTLKRGSFFTPLHMDILQCKETKELLAEAEEFGFIVAYDTMKTEI